MKKKNKSIKLEQIFYTDKVNSSIKKKISKFPLINKEYPNKNITKDCYIIVALNKTEVVGYILLEKPVDSLYPNIQYIEVKKEYRNKGIGTNLMHKVIKYAKNKWGNKITLYPLNINNKFFKKFGFKKRKNKSILIKSL